MNWIFAPTIISPILRSCQLKWGIESTVNYHSAQNNVYQPRYTGLWWLQYKRKPVVIPRTYIINTSQFMSLRLAEASSLRPDSPQTSPGNMTKKQSKPERLYRILRQSGRCDAVHDETIHDTVNWNQHYFAFIRHCVAVVYKYHVISWILSHIAEFRLLLIGINRAGYSAGAA